MLSASLDQIKIITKQFSNQKKDWHFHILTPECQLNNTDKYALILENNSDNQTRVCYSDNPPMEVGKELVQLLHGENIMAKEQKALRVIKSKNKINEKPNEQI